MAMAGKNNDEIPRSGIENHTGGSARYNYIVSEGSTVVFELHDFIIDSGINTYKLEAGSCRQTDSMPAVKLHYDNNRVSFTAPFIKGNEVNTILKFELSVKDNSNKTKDRSYSVSVIIKRIQRAIIFQGGVSLGAYEVGVFQALAEKLIEDDKQRGLENVRPLFDIVAGTSIGAMNAAVVVSSIVEGKSWKDSVRELVRFWKHQKYEGFTGADVLNENPMYSYWWDLIHNTSRITKLFAGTLMDAYSNLNPDLKNWYNILMNSISLDPNFWKDYFIDGWYIPATAEAARRYYSAKQFHTLGAPNVASGIPSWSIFGKFFDLSNQSNFLPRPDNKHIHGYSLMKTLEEFVHFPIITKKGQPRFLLVAVDVETGDAVTFDSYEKREKAKDVTDDSRYYSVYGPDEQNKHVLIYDDGINIDHVLASGTFPNFFDYPKFKVKDSALNYEEKEHIFWDGGFRSNTPLREVIHSHRDFWHVDDDDNEEDDVPDLEVYIADLWPSELREEPISLDLDFVENRKLNIIFADKTHYDEQMAEVVSDYIDLTKALKNLAERTGNSKEVKHLLEKHAGSKNRGGKIRKYKSLLGGRFRLTKVVRIDHKDDGNEVANKIYDYSHTTIEKLMKDGFCDALKQIGIQSIKDSIIRMIYKDGIVTETYELEQQLQQIENASESENGYNAMTNLIDGLVSIVKSIPEAADTQQEKELLIDSAKEFQEIMKRTKNLTRLPQIL
jgi:predicted acylesterase/phospholipase RssA